MDGGSRATILPLVLLLAVVGAVGVAMYFTLVPAGTPVEPPPDKPKLPDIREVPAVPGVVKNGTKPPPVEVRRSGGIIQGKVVTVEGEPVPDAIVRLYPAVAPKSPVELKGDQQADRTMVAELYQRFPEEAVSLYPLGAAPKRTPTDEKPLAETTTKENGEFRFKRPFWGSFRILAKKEGLSTGEQPVRGGPPITLTIRGSASLFGLVRFLDDSRPIGGASVTLRLAGREIVKATAANGTFRFEGLPPGNVRLEVAHPDYAGDILPRVPLGAGLEKELEITLTKGYTLTVTVRDLDDEEADVEPPVPGATVAAVRIADDGFVVGKSDESGIVVFPGLPPGDYYVNGIAVNFLATGEEKVKVRKDTEYTLYLERAVFSTLTVVDDQGRPIPGARIMTSDPDEEYHEGISKAVATTGADGTCRFAFDFDGTRAVVYAVKRGYAVGMATPDDPYEEEQIRIVLPASRTLRGRVTDPFGKPIEGARVIIEVTVEDPEQDDIYLTLYTNASGEYRWEYLPPGEIWIEVEKDGYESGDDDFETGPMREHVKNFTLEKEPE